MGEFEERLSDEISRGYRCVEKRGSQLSSRVTSRKIEGDEAAREGDDLTMVSQ
jgi:hypothetical protein